MSSAVLYLAIVAVWAVVLVPMWLRRDKHTEEPETAPTESTSPPKRPTRATIIARRRRRTAGLTLLLATTIGVVAPGVAPWWITLPPALLLAGHLALLRVAVQMDQSRRPQDSAAPQPASDSQAEIIELVPNEPEEVFDQYADDRQAVGE